MPTIIDKLNPWPSKDTLKAFDKMLRTSPPPRIKVVNAQKASKE